MIQYECPCCGSILQTSYPSTGRGVWVYCINVKNCPPSETVKGFGRNKEAAYNIILEKYGKHYHGKNLTKQKVNEPIAEPKSEELKDKDNTISYE